jgi:putative spermidine/putrescine transport system permease protein
MVLIISPLLVSLVVRGFAWLIVLGPQGAINVTLMKIGLITSPAKILHTQTAVTIGLAHAYYPFMVLSIYSALQNIDPAITRAATNLGAGPLRVFWRVVLPLSMPGVLAGSIIVFGLSMSTFVTPAILGGAFVKVLAYVAWEQETVVLDWPFAAAISAIILGVTCAATAAYNQIVERKWFEGAFR